MKESQQDNGDRMLSVDPTILNNNLRMNSLQV